MPYSKGSIHHFSSSNVLDLVRSLAVFFIQWMLSGFLCLFVYFCLWPGFVSVKSIYDYWTLVWYCCLYLYVDDIKRKKATDFISMVNFWPIHWLWINKMSIKNTKWVKMFIFLFYLRIFSTTYCIKDYKLNISIILTSCTLYQGLLIRKLSLLIMYWCCCNPSLYVDKWELSKEKINSRLACKTLHVILLETITISRYFAQYFSHVVNQFAYINVRYFEYLQFHCIWFHFRTRWLFSLF